MIRIASFDIGKKNFCFCVEEFSTDFENVIPPSVGRRYQLDGSPTEEMREILEKVYENGKIIHMGKYDISGATTEQTLRNLNDLLRRHLSIFDTCSVFLIEEQMKTNSMAMRLGHHTFSFFTFQYDRLEGPTDLSEAKGRGSAATGVGAQRPIDLREGGGAKRPK